MAGKSGKRFRDRMMPMERALGVIYLPVHIFILPILVGIFSAVSGGSGMTEDAEVVSNVVYYGISLFFVLVVEWRYLRESFGTFVQGFWKCMLAIIIACGMTMGLNFIGGMIVFIVSGDGVNPNSETVNALAGYDYGKMFAVGVFMAPIVEETLFRGVLFGALRRHSRIFAYAASIALFALYHLWQYMLLGWDWSLAIYALEYIPASLALAWAYEFTGSIWTPIFFHMLTNAAMMAISHALV